MMIVMKATATRNEIDAVIERIESVGAKAHPSFGAEVTVIGAIGDREHVARLELEGYPGVDKLVPILKPYKLASKQMREVSVFEIGGRKIGGEHFALIAGPCTVESREQTVGTAHIVKAAGATLFRGGAYKPRTSPYAFHGLGEEGLRLLAEAKAETGMPVVTELMDVRDLEPVLEVADVVQLGARNMQNYPLLKHAGRCGKPILLKRGIAATIQELLLSAEYILAEGNSQVILCERGIRGFDPATRNVFDLSAIPVVRALSHLPIVADPSHGTGHRDMVTPMARAAVAAGADGLLVEVHPNPDRALSDGAQSLYPEQFERMMKEIRLIADAIGRRVAEPAEMRA
jgi:3-deoxy-7-phosphoheptulonate synthase